MRRHLLGLLVIVGAAACADEAPELQLEANVMPDGGSLDGPPGAQRLRMAVGSVGIFGLRAILPSEPDEARWLGVGEAHACDTFVLDLRPVESGPIDGGVGIPERQASLAGTPLRQHDLQRFALLGARPGESCLEVPSSEGVVRVQVIVERR